MEGPGQGGRDRFGGASRARGVGRVVGGVGWDEYAGWGWHFGYLNNLTNLNNLNKLNSVNNLNNLNPARLNYLNFFII